MRQLRGLPHPALAGAVTRYVEFAERTASPRETRQVPGGGLVVIVDLDSGWSVEGERFGSFAGGLYPRPVRVRHEGSSHGVEINVEPPAARALLGVPAGELSQQRVALDDLLGVEAARLVEHLHAAPDARARFAILDTVLAAKLARARGTASPDIEHAWRLLRARRGRIRVHALADALACSRRHLAKRFAHDVGVSPKLAARLVRLEAARAALGTMPLARLATEFGYADQAHLAREFRAIAAAPPTVFPFLQDGADAST